jgi:hypothetical protein
LFLFIGKIWFVVLFQKEICSGLGISWAIAQIPDVAAPIPGSFSMTSLQKDILPQGIKYLGCY